MRPARLEGTWAVSGYELGEGPIYGRVTITADPAPPDEFTTTDHVSRTREPARRSRARAARSSTPDSSGAAVDDGGGDDAATARSDVRRSRLADDRRPLVHRRLRRVGPRRQARAHRRETRVLGTDRTALRQGATGQECRSTAPTCRRRCAARHRPRPWRHGHARVAATPDVATSRSTSPPARPSARATCSSPARRGRRSPCTTRSTPSRWRRPGGWRGSAARLPKMLAQFEAGLQQRPRRQAGHEGRIDLGLVEAPGASRSTPRRTTTTTSSSSAKSNARPDGSRRRRRPESGALAAIATTSATCGSSRRTRASRPAQAGADAPGARASGRDRAAVHALGFRR